MYSPTLKFYKYFQSAALKIQYRVHPPMLFHTCRENLYSIYDTPGRSEYIQQWDNILQRTETSLFAVNSSMSSCCTTGTSTVLNLANS